MNGRLDAGHSATTATYQPAETSTATPAASTCSTRLNRPVGAATRYTSANAGSTRNACNILAMNPNPIATPASASHSVLALSSARTVHQAPRVSSSTSSASGLLNLNISAATGVSAS